MWYHDHAIGTTRTTAYAGLATGYILYDPIVEAGLPVVSRSSSRTRSSTIRPRMQTPMGSSLAPGSATFSILTSMTRQSGQLVRWAAAASSLLRCRDVRRHHAGNGLVYPFKPVNGQYRFRLLNACNARFLRLQFVLEDPLVPGER